MKAKLITLTTTTLMMPASDTVENDQGMKGKSWRLERGTMCARTNHQSFCSNNRVCSCLSGILNEFMLAQSDHKRPVEMKLAHELRGLLESVSIPPPREVRRAQEGGIHLGMRPLVSPLLRPLSPSPNNSFPLSSIHPSGPPSILKMTKRNFSRKRAIVFRPSSFLSAAQRADRPFPGILAHPPRARRGNARSFLAVGVPLLTHSLCSIRKGNFPFPNHHARMTDGGTEWLSLLVSFISFMASEQARPTSG